MIIFTAIVYVLVTFVIMIAYVEVSDLYKVTVLLQYIDKINTVLYS